MEVDIGTVLLLFKDRYIFWFFEIALVFTLLLALCRSFKSNGGLQIRIKRSEKSWNHLNFILGLLQLIWIEILSEIIDKVDVVHDYKGIIMVFNFLALIYLCWFNAWFRNKIISYFIKLTNREDIL